MGSKTGGIVGTAAVVVLLIILGIWKSTQIAPIPAGSLAPTTALSSPAGSGTPFTGQTSGPKNPSCTPVAAATPGTPRSGWKTYTSASEGLHFSYPADWTANNAQSPGAASPCDALTLTSPNGTVVAWYSNFRGSTDCGPSPWYVVLDSITPMPGVPSAYFFQGHLKQAPPSNPSASPTDVSNSSEMGITDFRGKVPTIGSTVACSAGFFRSRDHTRTLVFSTESLDMAPTKLVATDAAVLREILLSTSY